MRRSPDLPRDRGGADLPRIRGWEARLAAHIEAGRAAVYRPGRDDCARFAAGAVRAVTGVDIWPKGLRRYSTLAGMQRALAGKGWKSLDDAATALLGPPMAPLAAHSGDVVSDGSALGVMTASGPVALSEAGLVAMGQVLRAWPAGRAGAVVTKARRTRPSGGTRLHG